MEQIDLLDWLDETAVIRAAPPADAVQQREWLKKELSSVMRELDYLNVSPQAVSEALHYYANQYALKAQSSILDIETDAEDCV
ncbi:MAG: hypothetical protein ACRBDL_08985 [Alphaproteobacteria bacterium]